MHVEHAHVEEYFNSLSWTRTATIPPSLPLYRAYFSASAAFATPVSAASKGVEGARAPGLAAVEGVHCLIPWCSRSCCSGPGAAGKRKA